MANSPLPYQMIPQQTLGFLLSCAGFGIVAMNSKAAMVTVLVQPLPEGVWLATSDDIPGLVVETETREEAIDLARHLAGELMDLEGIDRAHQPRVAFIFH